MSKHTSGRWITEMLVIVGSILLAFSLDAWWNERVRVSELESDLLDVRRELVAASEELQLVGRFHALRHVLAKRIEETLDASSSGVALLRAGDVGLLLPQSTSDFRTITVETFMASGGLELLDDQASLAFQRWPGVAADLVDDQIDVRETTERYMTPTLRSAADLRPAIFGDFPTAVEEGGPDDLIEVKVSRELLNLFAWRRFAEWEVARTAESACLLAVEMIAAIDARIPNNAGPITPAHCTNTVLPAWVNK